MSSRRTNGTGAHNPRTGRGVRGFWDNARLRPNVRARVGFTLVEVMVVLVIIGLLAGVVTLNVRGYMSAGYQNTVKMELRSIMDALDSFQVVTGRLPTNEEGLKILATSSDKFPDPLLSRIPTDPWGKPYEYVSPGHEHPYEITCYGADGRPGGTGTDADINCWSLRSEK